MSAAQGNILFSHSGGVSCLVNIVASTLHNHKDKQKLFICRNGISGLKAHQWHLSDDFTHWQQIAQSPASAFGSSRVYVPNVTDNALFYEQLFTQFKKDNITTFLCNGGNQSQNIVRRIHQAAKALNFPLTCIGIPKTIDNDILQTDTCIGFGSAAKYTAISMLEASLDLQSMCHSASQVVIYQAMGRNSGWLAAASKLASLISPNTPHMVLVPEADIQQTNILNYADDILTKYNHLTICIAEGVSLGGDSNLPPGYQLNQLIENHLNTQNHVVIPDYLQRSARHIASTTDIDQARQLTLEALKLAKLGYSDIMTTIVREKDTPYLWSVGHIELEKVAGYEKKLPSHFIEENQMNVNDTCIDFLKPLIQGEAYPTYLNGMPNYYPMKLWS